MTDEVETTTFSISSEDGATDDVTIPSGLVDLVAEGDQTDVETVGDVMLLSFASRAHHIVHHGEDADPELEAQEERVMDLFEERFGVTFGEATGHQH
ncbi:hypothetical protein C488_03085 [Natrinema pellirubrum DSM 15624]|uniref:Uncharacterized protein n=2 Tax=Natrinema TaxID=88723 RepID=L0JJX6_NATP1|nr:MULTISPECIES: hypothetical protein [Natrinema]ELZ12055.1 hypothetical protein C478_10653 [Natrinema thermotolerans DSM 11552]AGB30872.1 hypothetical protein Natpe_0959 [Natrinema pellirubrum DSM 15624]ELY80739.1 hypothetical protein C488_03085 [Natrinema pellirubrum DSM 15624]QCC59702.1 hypothetical protein DVR14_14120 [Natrinema thermotolerans]WMT06686.1 hypothetical protein NP511_14985 [Natrinema thermotolerans]